MTAKQQVQHVLNELPDDCTLEEVQYRLYVIDKVNRGLEAADRGETVSHAQVKDRVKSWLKQ